MKMQCLIRAVIIKIVYQNYLFIFKKIKLKIENSIVKLTLIKLFKAQVYLYQTFYTNHETIQYGDSLHYLSF